MFGTLKSASGSNGAEAKVRETEKKNILCSINRPYPHFGSTERCKKAITLCDYTLQTRAEKSGFIAYIEGVTSSTPL